MSQNIFPIDPIFFLPIDFEDNSKNKEEDSPKSDIIYNSLERNKKNKESTENESTNEDSSSGKELDQSIDSGDIQSDNSKKAKNADKNEQNDIIVFSKNVNDRHIKSMTNSSKIYICEIFKQNWKLKARRLITKLKKRLIKEYQNSLLKEENKIGNVNNNIYNNYINKVNKVNKVNNNTIDINSMNGNKIDNIYNNRCIYNNPIMSNNLSNNLNDNRGLNLLNIYPNLDINLNQLNNSYQINNNAIFNNNNKLEQLKKFLILKNICY